MLARNSGLVSAGQLELDALLLQLAEELRVQQSERRLASERLQQVERLVR
jgi:hypothetical protein